MPSPIFTKEQVNNYRQCFIKGLMTKNYIIEETKLWESTIDNLLNNKRYFDKNYDIALKERKSKAFDIYVSPELTNEFRRVLTTYKVPIITKVNLNFKAPNNVNKKAIFISDKNDDHIKHLLCFNISSNGVKYTFVRHGKYSAVILNDGYFDHFVGFSFKPEDIIETIKVNEYPNYYVTSMGDVITLNYDKIMSESIHPNGYTGITIQDNKITKKYLVHRLVAEHFIPNPENKPQVNHINGIKTDNRVTNLEWVTVEENHKHAVETGLLTIGYGEDAPSGKLTNDQATTIRKLFWKEKVPEKDLAEQFGINRKTINMIINYKTFKHIATKEELDDYAKAKAIYNRTGTLSLDDVNRIRELYLTGDYSQPKLAEMFNTTQSTILLTVNFKIHKFGKTDEEIQAYKNQFIENRNKSKVIDNQGIFAKYKQQQTVTNMTK